MRFALRRIPPRSSLQSGSPQPSDKTQFSGTVESDSSSFECGKQRMPMPNIGPDVKIPISETFRSLQGEGPYSGMPATFIRTGYCNLHCDWCDAWYTWNVGRVPNIKSTFKWMTQ